MTRKNIEDVLSYDEGSSAEKDAQLIAEELLFEASVAKSAFNHMMRSEEGKPSYHWARANVRERVGNAQKLYEEGLEIETPDPELYMDRFEQSAEEMLYRNKWSASSFHSSDSVVDELEAEHNQNRVEAIQNESLSTNNPYTLLMQAISSYEVFINRIDDFLELEDVELFEHDEVAEVTSSNNEEKFLTVR